jgi:hypothetical protein
MGKKKLARMIGVCSVAIMIIVVITILPSCQLQTSKPPTYGLQFDGVDDDVDLGANASLKPTAALTVAAWINPQTPTTSREPAVVGNARYTAPQVGGYELLVYPVGVWNGTGWDGNWTVITSYVISLTLHRGVAQGQADWRGLVSVNISVAKLENQWHHIVAVFDKPTIEIFVDGVEVANSSYNYDISYNVTTITLIGASNWQRASQRFSGTISEVRIYNRALDATEIKSLYTGSDVTNGLVGYWKLNEGSGTIAHDSTANNNTGTLYGSPVWFTGGG